MPKLSILLPPAAAILLAGCTAMDVVTLPVKVAKTGVNAAGAAVDAVTTSQSEADQKRGREIRKREEQLGKLHRRYAELADKCRRGDDRACRNAVAARADIDRLAPGLPLER